MEYGFIANLLLLMLYCPLSDCKPLYDPKKSGSISLNGLHGMIHVFIVDIVCQMSHPKFGIPRIDVWRAATVEFPPALPSAEKDLRRC